MRYRFVPMGAVHSPASGELWLDVGNRLAPGVIDHHQSDASPSCTARLVLDHPELVRAAAADLAPGVPLTIVTHHGPDLDAVTASLLVRRLLDGAVTAGARAFAHWVCAVDRGETRLDPHRPLTTYALFQARQHLARTALPPGTSADERSRALLDAGTALVERCIALLDAGVALAELGDELVNEADLTAEVELIRADLESYRRDLARAEQLRVRLPTPTGERAEVPGLWIERPESLLFKAWARGDCTTAHDERGFVLLGVGLSPTRTIISVQPDCDVWLHGLGAALEQAETAKRRRLGRERKGSPRPGYDSPDPWYDGRSPLHGWTIVDAPNVGSVLTPAEIRAVFENWLVECV